MPGAPARISAESTFGESVQQLVIYFQLQQGLGDKFGGTVEDATAKLLNQLLGSLGAFDNGDVWSVQGNVTQAGKPKAGVTVEASDRDLRKYQSLGKATTDGDGNYRIDYRGADFEAGERPERRGPWLVVRATDEAGGEQVIFEKSKDVQRHEKVDLVLQAASTSEWERIAEAVLPLLAGQAPDGGPLSVADLTDDDLAFIVEETGIDWEQLRLWTIAARRAPDLDLGGSAVPVGASSHGSGAGAGTLSTGLAWVALYAWFRTGVDPTIEAVREQPPAELRRRLYGAIDTRIIPGSLRASVDAIVEQAGEGKFQAVKQLLSHIELAAEAAQDIASRLGTVDALDDLTLTGLIQAGALDEAQADRLGVAATLYRAIGADAKAVESGLTRKFDSLGGRPIRKSEDLARLTAPEWIALLEEGDAPVPQGSTVEAFAAGLEEDAVGAYPTVGMLQRAMREPSALSAQVDMLQPRNDLLKKLWETPLASAEADQLMAKLPAEQQAAFVAARRAALRHPALTLDGLTLAGLIKAVSEVTSSL